MTVGSAVGISTEDVQEDLDDLNLLTPWATTVDPTRIEFGGVHVDTNPNDQSGFGYVGDNGFDLTNTQIGTSGSAFLFNRKARGTIANPTALQNEDIIGWFAFGAFTGSTYQHIGGLRSNVTVSGSDFGGDLTLAVKPSNGLVKDAVKVDENGEVYLFEHDQDRDDGPAPNMRYLWIDSNHKINTGIIHVYEETLADDDINQTTTAETIATVSAPGNGPAGVYHIVASAMVSIDGTGADYIGQVLQGTTALGRDFRREGKDSAGTGIAADGDNSGTDQRVSLYIRRSVTLPENSTQSFSFTHRSSANNVEASTFDLILSLELKKAI